MQFGINGNPTIAERQRHITIPGDPLNQHNNTSYVAFSNTGPNTRSTQIYINLGDNTARNDIEAGFAPFGQVVEGMDVVEKLYGRYGEHSGGGMRAGHQKPDVPGRQRLSRSRYPKLGKLIRATLTKSN